VKSGVYRKAKTTYLPTPIEPLDRLSDHLGGPRIWIKRDDCTGLSTGGNKARKLDFLIGDALDKGADCVVTIGSIQSNHARQTAAAAAKYGLGCYLLLQDNLNMANEPGFAGSGNIFLDRLHGAKVFIHPADECLNNAMLRLAETLRSEQHNPYMIPLGGSNFIGTLGYVQAAEEILTQADALNIEFDTLIHATGSGGTQAGLIVGLLAHQSPIKVVGVSVDTDATAKRERVSQLARETSRHLNLNLDQARLGNSIHVTDDYIGVAYGVPSTGSVHAVKLLAELEGLLLDPIYSGKAMAALIDKIKTRKLDQQTDLLFLYTGSSASLFAYVNSFV